MESRIKILHLGMSPNRGGIEIMVHSWWQNIEKDKFHFDFINARHEPIAFEDEFRESGSEIYRIPAIKENPGKHRKELKRIIKEGGYTLLQKPVNYRIHAYRLSTGLMKERELHETQGLIWQKVIT